MKTFVAGIGGCGKNIALQLYSHLSHKYVYTDLIKNFDFFAVDNENISTKDIESIGIPKEVINLKPTDERIKPLNVFLLSPTSAQTGVGGKWILSSKMALEYINFLNDSARLAECFNIFNGAGGGTGCGAGPVFLEYLHRNSENPSRKLYTATIVLPFKNEEEWRYVNTAVNIARYSNFCDGILIADNEHIKVTTNLDTKNVYKEVNEILSNVWICMNACSSPHMGVSPQCMEASGFKRNFKIGICGVPIVPCYREVPVEKLSSISVEWFVLSTIIDNCAASCLPDTSERVLVIVSKPDNVGCTRSESDIKDYISKELFKGERSSIEVIFINRRAMKHASIVVLLVAPKIPRLEELEKKFKVYIEDQRLFDRDLLVEGLSRDEVFKAYKNEYDTYKKYIWYLKKYS